MASDIYGQCARCGGNLTNGHVCMESNPLLGAVEMAKEKLKLPATETPIIDAAEYCYAYTLESSIQHTKLVSADLARQLERVLMNVRDGKYPRTQHGLDHDRCTHGRSLKDPHACVTCARRFITSELTRIGEGKL